MITADYLFSISKDVTQSSDSLKRYYMGLEPPPPPTLLHTNQSFGPVDGHLFPGQREEVKLENLKVLRRSPDLLNNVQIGHGHLQLIKKQILFNHIWWLQPFWSSDLNNLMNNPSNSPVISEKRMFR